LYRRSGADPGKDLIYFFRIKGIKFLILPIISGMTGKGLLRGQFFIYGAAIFQGGRYGLLLQSEY
jgi:hypothetical protein